MGFGSSPTYALLYFLSTKLYKHFFGMLKVIKVLTVL